MRDVFLRLRAALTPQALLVLLSLLLLAGGLSARNDGEETPLEKRIAQTLSAMEGAGRVRVVIKTTVQQGGLSASGAEIPCGAVAVAQGASDPLVRLELEEALCALLGLPAQAVSVVAGER